MVFPEYVADILFILKLAENMIRGLDDDEVDFLEYVDKTKQTAELNQQKEDAQEMEEFRNRVANMQEKEIDEKIKANIAISKSTKTPAGQRPSQKSILKGIVVQKRKADPEKSPQHEPKKLSLQNGPPMKCIGILPGISNEYSATDSEDSSDSDDEGSAHPGRFDLTGRVIQSHCNGE